MNKTAKMEDAAEYRVIPQRDTASDDAIIARALEILEARMRKPGQAFDAPDDVKSYFRLSIGEKPHEVFSVLFLDTQNRLLACEEMFRGTLTQTSVYPREVAIAALKHQASAVVLSHNHPSGAVEPSRADIALTQTLKAALALVDVRVLDHIIVAPDAALSMAERGML